MALKLIQGKQLNTNLTGSFTGSFKGDGSLLTGVTGEWDGTLNGNAQITGSLSQGTNNLTLGNFSHAEGYLTVTSGSYSHAEGSSTQAIGDYSHTEGNNTRTGGTNGYLATSVVSGLVTLSGDYGDVSADYLAGDYLYLNDLDYDGSLPIGSFVIDSATFNGTETEIQLIDVSVSISTAVVGNLNIGALSWAGDQIYKGPYSHAEGDQTIAPSQFSHAEGRNTVASGDWSHAEGYITRAIGQYSHAEGTQTQAIGYGSHAEGDTTQTIGEYSHAEGLGTITSGSYQHVQGQYNITSSAQSAFIIGNGTDENNRSNLLFASGSQVQITGSLTVSGSNTFTNIGPAVFSGSINVTQGISGSFSGSGANLNSIPASAITGLSSTQIATGSITASVSTGTESFQITSGSTSLMFISSSGNVGIGTSTPTSKLHLSGSSTFVGGTYLFKANGAGDAGIQIDNLINGYTSLNWASNAVGLGLIAGGGLHARVGNTSGFNIGKGTISANIGAVLGVRGNGATSATTALLVQNSTPTTTFSILDNGNVGVGLASPSASLHISGASSAALLEIDSPAVNNILFVSGSGRVGIGTSTPAFTLDVSGSARFQVSSGATTNQFTIVSNTSRLDINPYDASTYGVILRPSVTNGGAYVPLTLWGTRINLEGAVHISTAATGGNTSAMLDVTSTTKGFLPPRMTNAERLLISTPAVGLMVYCTDATEGLYVYKSTGWTFIA